MAMAMAGKRHAGGASRPGCARMQHPNPAVEVSNPGVFVSRETYYGKQASKTTDCALADGFEGGADVADDVNSGVVGGLLQPSSEDQLAEEKGDLMANALHEMIFPGKYTFPLKPYDMFKPEYADQSMLCVRQVKMIDEVATVKQPVANLERTVEIRTSVYSNHRTKAVCPVLGVSSMCQVWLLLLFVLLSAPQVLSSTKDESAEIGSCLFDKTSLAVLSCLETDGKWRPPSVTCCNALLYAIDQLPASNESGACCLCRYIYRKYPNPGLATSYALCQGKDSRVVASWSFPLQSCYLVCERRNALSLRMGTPAQKDPPVVYAPDTGSRNLKIMWIAAACAAFCVILLVWRWHLWCYKLRVKSLPLNLQHQGLSPEHETRAERKRSQRSSAQQRKMSTVHASPNG